MKPRTKGLLILAGCLFCLFALWALGIFRTKPSAEASKAFLNIGKTETESSMTSSSTMSSSDKATFSSRHVLLLNRSSNPLGNRVASLVMADLKTNRRIERVDFGVPPITDGKRPPDLFIAIDMLTAASVGILGGNVNARASISMSTAPWQASHYTSDSTRPAAVHINYSGTIEVRSKFKGVRSDRYAEVAQDIAAHFSKAISNEIETLSTKFPPMPDLPNELYGPYEAVNDFGFLNNLGATRSFSYAGLLTHNETFWTFVIGTNRSVVLENALSNLREAGWKISSEPPNEAASYYARLSKDGAELEIFQTRRHALAGAAEGGERNVPNHFVAHYRKPFSRETREKALKGLFTSDRPVEVLLAFENCMSPDLRNDLNTRLETAPVTSASVGLRVTEHFLAKQNTNAALARLCYAKALSCGAPDPSTVESSIADLSKKISPGQKLKVTITPSICREMGFIEVTNGLAPLKVERHVGEPVWLFESNGEYVHIASFSLEGPENGPYRWVINRSEGMSRSRSSQGAEFNNNLRAPDQTFNLEKQNIRVQAERVEGNRFRYFITQAGISDL